jgi:coenzyme PQQ biosynthesis protein PqqD
VIALETRPRLAAKARLRYDRHAGEHLLLYPERGLALSASAAAIVELCTGDLTVEQMIERLRGRYGPAASARLGDDVRAFLGTLVDRGLLEER